METKWLVVTCFISSLTAWLIVTAFTGSFNYWLFIWFFIPNLLLTMNGDNMIESMFAIVVLGICTAVFAYYDSVPSFIGRVNLIAFYFSFTLSKIVFALAKVGKFANTPF
ncbi:MAG: hypothetical protein KZQ83_19680 [gamma proteobacterium symbiont of Taylorina sp.]|nr:hypothetical protein [gamma proteobacterium symbiont of Taylorina sp.]